MSSPAAAARIVEALGDAFRAMAGPGLVPLVEGLAGPLAAVDDRVAVTDRGWASVFDLNATPDPAWLGSVIGSPVPAGMTTEQAREFVRTRAYWRRGTPAAIQAAVAVHLTGLRRVVLRERDGGPWQLTVQVYNAELAPGVTLAHLQAAVASQKPVGIIATVQLVAGASYGHMAAEHGPTYAVSTSEFPTHAAATNHLPEEGTTP